MMHDGGPPLLRTEDIEKSFGAVQALAGVSLDIFEGQICGLIGPNGSGKSTLFDCCTGLQRPDAGRVYLDGTDITDWPMNRISRHGRMLRSFQRTVVFSAIDPVENLVTAGQMFVYPNMLSTFSIGAAARARDRRLREKAHELVATVGLSHVRHQPAGNLSIGQQKLLQFAMMIMAEPRLLLLDEPLAGVNPVLIEKMVEGIRAANRDHGVTFVIVEHNMDAVFELCHRTIVLDQGRMLADSDPASIVKDPKVVEAYLGG